MTQEGAAGCLLCPMPDIISLPHDVRWEVRSPQRIALSFQNAGVSDIRITSLLESFIAPAMLPRDSLQQAILLAIKEVLVAADVPDPCGF